MLFKAFLKLTVQYPDPGMVLTCMCLCVCVQLHLKNVIQALISSQTSWLTKEGTKFHHSFGQGPSTARVLPSRPCSPSSSPSPSRQLSGGRKFERQEMREAKAIQMASLNTPIRQMQPLNLFHLRDALRVGWDVIKGAWRSKSLTVYCFYDHLPDS